MEIPREKLRFTRGRGGETRARGWLTINLRGLDLEGVNELVLSLDDVEAVCGGTRSGTEPDAVARARELLGG